MLSFSLVSFRLSAWTKKETGFHIHQKKLGSRRLCDIKRRLFRRVFQTDGNVSVIVFFPKACFYFISGNKNVFSHLVLVISLVLVNDSNLALSTGLTSLPEFHASGPITFGKSRRAAQ